MFNLPTPEPKVGVTQMAFADALDALKFNRRAYLDLLTRQRVLSSYKGGKVQLSTGNDEAWDHYFRFWSQYAAHVGVTVIRKILDNYPSFPKYPAPTQSLCYFTSDQGDGRAGFESTLLRETLYANSAIHLTGAEHHAEHVFMLEGFLAILGPALGFAVTMIGDERFSGRATTFSHAVGIEQTEWWWRAWNDYIGPVSSIQSVCGAMHRDDVVNTVLASTPLDQIGSCNKAGTAKGGWCGSCWKCCSTAYIVWAYHGTIPFYVSADAVEQTLADQAAYHERGVDKFRSLGLLDRVAGKTNKTLRDFGQAL